MSFDEIQLYLDVRHESVQDIARNLEVRLQKQKPQVGKEQLVERICRFLTSGQHLDNEDSRIGAVKLLFALMPVSFGHIVELIKRTDYPLYGEVHFTLFCFTDEMLSLAVAERHEIEIIDVVKEYIMGGKTDQTYALWMAAHALGGHLTHTYVVDALSNAVVKARSEEGRKAALTGLQECFLRFSDATDEKILSQIERVARTDRSKTVRLLARAALADFRTGKTEKTREQRI